MALDGREARNVCQGKSRNLGLSTRGIILIKGRRTSRVGTCSKKRPTVNGQAEGFRLECKRPPLDLPLATKAPPLEEAKPSNRASLSALSARKARHVSCCRGVLSCLSFTPNRAHFVCTCDCVVIMNFNQHVFVCGRLVSDVFRGLRGHALQHKLLPAVKTLFARLCQTDCRVGNQSGFSLLTRNNSTVHEEVIGKRCSLQPSLTGHMVSNWMDIYGGGVNFRTALAFGSCGCVSRETLSFGGAILPLWWHLCVLGCCFESARKPGLRSSLFGSTRGKTSLRERSGVLSA